MPLPAPHASPHQLTVVGSQAHGESLALAPQSHSSLAPALAAPHGYTVLLAPHPQAVAPGAAPAPVTVIHVREIVRYLRDHWKLGALVGGVAAVLVFVMLGLGDKVYETEAKIEVRIQEASLLRLDNTGGGLSEQSSLQIVNNHKTNLRTRRFVDYVYSQLPPEVSQAYLLGVDALSWRRKLFISLGFSDPPPVLKPEDHFSAKLDKALRVEPVKDSHILRVIVQDGDPAVAALLANSYAQGYRDYVEHVFSSDATSAQDRISDKVNEAKVRLNAAETALAEFSQKADLLDAGQGGDMSKLNVEQLAKADSDLDVELLKARQRVVQLRTLMAAGKDPSGVRGVGDDLHIIELQKKLIENRTRLAALAEYCGPKHPKLIQTKGEIARLEHDITVRVEDLVTGAESEERRLASEKAQLAIQIIAARQKAFGQNPNRTQMKQLADEVARQSKLYTDLSQHEERARLTAELGGNSHLEVIDLAQTPDSPIKPRKSLALMASVICFCLLGLGAPVGLGLGRDHIIPLLRPTPTEPSAKQAATAETAEPAPPQPAPQPPSYQQAAAYRAGAALPPRVGMPSAADLPVPPQRTAAAAPYANLHVLTRIPELRSVQGPMQLSEVLHDPRLHGDSTLLQIASLVEETRPPNAGPVILLVTSANPGEGKSLFAAALSASLSTIGRSVLLIDGNPSAPGLPHYFPHSASFSALAPDLEALRYGQSTMFLLTTNDLPSSEMAELVEGYLAWIRRAEQQRIDWIIIDSGALLPAFADVALLAPMSTDTIVVFDTTRSDMRQMKAALSLLRPVVPSESVRGIVLNRQ